MWLSNSFQIITKDYQKQQLGVKTTWILKNRRPRLVTGAERQQGNALEGIRQFYGGWGRRGRAYIFRAPLTA